MAPKKKDEYVRRAGRRTQQLRRKLIERGRPLAFIEVYEDKAGQARVRLAMVPVAADNHRVAVALGTLAHTLHGQDPRVTGAVTFGEVMATLAAMSSAKRDTAEECVTAVVQRAEEGRAG